jgi:hypothetical protein
VSAKPLYPYLSGDFTVIGPECFTDGKVIAYKGQNYTRQPRTITTAEEIRNLPALTIVVYDDTATGGLLQTYVVPDDGTVMFKDSGEFHLMTFGGDYIDAKDMPLPLTAVYEAGQ